MSDEIGQLERSDMLVIKDGLPWVKKDGADWRAATPEECAREIDRLQKMVADIRYAFDAIFNPGVVK